MEEIRLTGSEAEEFRRYKEAKEAACGRSGEGGVPIASGG